MKMLFTNKHKVFYDECKITLRKFTLVPEPCANKAFRRAEYEMKLPQRTQNLCRQALFCRQKIHKFKP